jgi:hypothetical protein
LLKERVRKLEEAIQEKVNAASVAMILESFTQSYTQAEGKKRRVVLNALVNAFDPELYEKSMTALLFATMDQLTYGDLEYLKSMEGRSAPRQPWKQPGSLNAFHASRLAESKLVFRERINQPYEDEDVAHVSELGQWMIRLVRDPQPRAAAG